MISPNPEPITGLWDAFVGWAWVGPSEGFGVKLCPQCEGFKQASAFFASTPKRTILCGKHHYLSLTKRMGESNP